MNSTIKAMLWILFGYPLLFLFFAWIVNNPYLFYYSIPIAILISLIMYFVSRKQKIQGS
jgi:hypothetical protein